MTISNTTGYLLVDSDYIALEVLVEHGCSSKAPSTIVNEARGVRCIAHQAARNLIAAGAAAELAGWNAVEATDLGRQLHAARSAR